MEILSFKMRGKFAHFRKYFANNTAFTFTIPPRTTLMGIVAAGRGWERDSYYEKLASNKIRFGVRVITPLKKSFHRLNFLSIKTLGNLSKSLSSDFRGDGGRIQTPFEIVTGLNISKDDVVYQIFIKPEESGIETFEDLKNHFKDINPVFNVSYGIANFSASIYDVQIIDNDRINILNSNDFVLLNSAIPSNLVDELKFEKEEYANYNFVEEDMLPGDFKANMNREVSKMNRILFSTTQNPLRVRINSEYFEVKLISETVNIQFMDS